MITLHVVNADGGAYNLQLHCHLFAVRQSSPSPSFGRSVQRMASPTRQPLSPLPLAPVLDLAWRLIGTC